MDSYEKKYKEALERAKEIYNSADKPDRTLVIAEKLPLIFPELKESEDERIRKEIIAFINVHWQDTNKPKRREWTDWLEKQKPYHPVPQKELLGEAPIEEGATEHEYVDLGLPSGTKWASCNVGATKPEEYGGYYAWGETEEKEVYDWSTYIHCDGSKETCHNLGSDISGTQYDVAHVKWGGKWRMPTQKQCDELIYNCTSEWTTLNGVNGRKFTSKINGNSIFLPAAGFRWDGSLYGVGGFGYYWSSTPGDGDDAYYLYFRSGSACWYDGWVSSYRYCGRSIRPVIKHI